jgi:hypothetical protein
MKTILKQAAISFILAAGFMCFGLVGAAQGQDFQSVRQDLQSVKTDEAANESSVPAQATKCTTSSLAGRYGFLVTGTIVANFPGISPGPHANVGTVTLSSNGSILLAGAQSFNGQILPANGSGIYTVSADCTGSGSFSNGVSFNFVVVDNAREFYFIQTLQ